MSGADTQAVPKTLRGLGLVEDLLVQVAKSLQPPATKKASSRERQMAHLKEQLHNLRGRIEKHSESVRKHSEQFQLMVAKLDGLKREETEKEAQYRELKKLTPSSAPARSPLASAPRSPAVSVGDDEDQLSSDDNGGCGSGMDLDQGLEGGLTPSARPGGPPPLTFELPPPSPLLNKDADTNYVENGDGSKRLKVDATIGQTVPDASTLSKAFRRGQYTSDEARIFQKSLAKVLEQHQEELEDAAATAAHFGEHEDGENGVALVNKMLGGPQRKNFPKSERKEI